MVSLDAAGRQAERFAALRNEGREGRVQEWTCFLPELKSRQVFRRDSVPLRKAVRSTLSFEVNDLAEAQRYSSTLETFSLLWHGLCTDSLLYESSCNPGFEIRLRHKRKRETPLQHDA